MMDTEAKIDQAEAVLGVTLLPWQRQYVAAVMRGEQLVMHRGRRCGWTTVQRAVSLAMAPGEVTP